MSAFELATGAAPAFAGARVTRDAAQTFTNNTQTSMTFNTEIFDTDGFHDNVTNNTRLTIPAGLGGWYMIGGSIDFLGNSAGRRVLFIELNADPARNIVGIKIPVLDANASSLNVDTLYQAVAGDFFELRALQNSGGDLDDIIDEEAAPIFWLAKVG